MFMRGELECAHHVRPPLRRDNDVSGVHRDVRKEFHRLEWANRRADSDPSCIGLLSPQLQVRVLSFFTASPEL
jgi:hypothetical protein